MKRIYSHETEEVMINFYDRLSEKDKRRDAAIEVKKLHYGGQKYISNLLGCDEKTIQRGLIDLDNEAELKKKE